MSLGTDCAILRTDCILTTCKPFALQYEGRWSVDLWRAFLHDSSSCHLKLNSKAKRSDFGENSLIDAAFYALEGLWSLAAHFAKQIYPSSDLPRNPNLWPMA